METTVWCINRNHAVVFDSLFVRRVADSPGDVEVNGMVRRRPDRAAEIRGHDFPRPISAPMGVRPNLSKSAGNGYVSSFPRIFATNGIRADHVNVVNVPRFRPELHATAWELRELSQSSGWRLTYPKTSWSAA
jgi:hypothetical protein